MSVSPAELALRVEDVGIEPDVRISESVAPNAGVGQDGEGPFGVAARLGCHRQTSGGYPFPAGIADLTGPGERLQESRRSGRGIGAGQVNLTAKCLRPG